MKNHNPLIQFMFCFLISAFGYFGLAQNPAEEDTEEDKPEPIVLQKDLSVLQISGDVWMWTALKNPDGKPPALNGLLYITDTMVICVNVPWHDKHVDGLSKFCLDKLQRRLGKLILTGFQPVREPALKRFDEMGLQFHGTLSNATLSRSRNLPGPDLTFTARQSLEIDGRVIHLLNPGSILARDHVIVYIPNGEVLFLGQLIKSPRSKLKGISKPRLEAWEKALQTSQRRFPNAEHLIPERGPMYGKRIVAMNYVLIRNASK